MDELFGDWTESYNALGPWLAIVYHANEGIVVDFAKFSTTEANTEVFHQVFWVFDLCIQGFQFCRPLISIDATYLYDRYKGTLMIAMGRDENGSIYPLTFVICEGENRSSWS